MHRGPSQKQPLTPDKRLFGPRFCCFFFTNWLTVAAAGYDLQLVRNCSQHPAETGSLGIDFLSKCLLWEWVIIEDTLIFFAHVFYTWLRLNYFLVCWVFCLDTSIRSLMNPNKCRLAPNRINNLTKTDVI